MYRLAKDHTMKGKEKKQWPGRVERIKQTLKLRSCLTEHTLSVKKITMKAVASNKHLRVIHYHEARLQLLRRKLVQEGSMKSNHPELVCKHPTHLVPHVLEKVRYSRTAPNSCERTLHALLALQWRYSRRFEEVRCGRTTPN